MRQRKWFLIDYHRDSAYPGPTSCPVVLGWCPAALADALARASSLAKANRGIPFWNDLREADRFWTSGFLTKGRERRGD